MLDLQIYQADLTNAEHCDAIVRLINEYAHDPLEVRQSLPNDVLARMTDGLREHPTLVFLAQREGAIIGVAVCLSGYTTFAARPALNIHDLAVTAAQRGRGAGTALLAAVERHARQIGCARITLEVRAANHAARRLYQRNGFDGAQHTADDGATLFCVKQL